MESLPSEAPTLRSSMTGCWPEARPNEAGATGPRPAAREPAVNDPLRADPLVDNGGGAHDLVQDDGEPVAHVLLGPLENNSAPSEFRKKPTAARRWSPRSAGVLQVTAGNGRTLLTTRYSSAVWSPLSSRTAGFPSLRECAAVGLNGRLDTAEGPPFSFFTSLSSSWAYP